MQKTSYKDFEFLSTLGKGAFSTVYLVKRKKDNKLYALKSIIMDRLSKIEQQNSVNEVRILSSINNPYIIAYKEAFWNDINKTLNIVMEYCDDGDLELKINIMKRNKNKFDEKLIWNYAIQILLGLKALHDKKIIHRDLKSANIFLSKFNNLCKIGDLNIGKVLKKNKDINLSDLNIGTPSYSSPEVWKKEKINYKSDIWSLGCIIYEMCCLKVPFKGKTMDELKNNIFNGKFEKISSRYSKELFELINLMLEVDLTKRPDCNMLLKNKIVNDKLISLSKIYKSINYSENEDESSVIDTIEYKNLWDLKNKIPLKKKYDKKHKKNNKDNDLTIKNESSFSELSDIDKNIIKDDKNKNYQKNNFFNNISKNNFIKNTEKEMIINKDIIKNKYKNNSCGYLIHLFPNFYRKIENLELIQNKTWTNRYLITKKNVKIKIFNLDKIDNIIPEKSALIKLKQNIAKKAKKINTNNPVIKKISGKNFKIDNIKSPQQNKSKITKFKFKNINDSHNLNDEKANISYSIYKNMKRNATSRKDKEKKFLSLKKDGVSIIQKRIGEKGNNYLKNPNKYISNKLINNTVNILLEEKNNNYSEKKNKIKKLSPKLNKIKKRCIYNPISNNKEEIKINTKKFHSNRKSENDVYIYNNSFTSEKTKNIQKALNIKSIEIDLKKDNINNKNILSSRISLSNKMKKYDTSNNYIPSKFCNKSNFIKINNK